MVQDLEKRVRLGSRSGSQLQRAFPTRGERQRAGHPHPVLASRDRLSRCWSAWGSRGGKFNPVSSTKGCCTIAPSHAALFPAAESPSMTLRRATYQADKGAVLRNPDLGNDQEPGSGRPSPVPVSSLRCGPLRGESRPSASLAFAEDSKRDVVATSVTDFFHRSSSGSDFQSRAVHRCRRNTTRR